MIRYLRGLVLKKEAGGFVLLAGGVGFFLQAPTPFLQALEEGKEVGVHTHLLLKEEGLSLYGFPDEENLALFELLLSVSGVGPKVALAPLGFKEAQARAVVLDLLAQNPKARAQDLIKEALKRLR